MHPRCGLRTSLLTVLLASAVAAPGCGAASDDPQLDQSSQDTTEACAARLGFGETIGKGVVLTFDDGPDGAGYTEAVLDALLEPYAGHAPVKATFFVNTRNCVNVSASTAAQNTIRRIVAEGHELGNHTARHRFDLPSLSDADFEAEIKEVEDVLATLEIDKPTLLRMPGGNLATGNRLLRVISEHGVHIAWNLSTGDAGGCKSVECELETLRTALDKGLRGNILAHSINPWTPNAVAGIVQELEKRNIPIVTNEDLVRAKYGKSSKELVGKCAIPIDTHPSGSTDPCTVANGGPGAYCGGSLNLPPSDPNFNSLFHCAVSESGDLLTQGTPVSCPSGCIIAAPGIADECNTTPTNCSNPLQATCGDWGVQCAGWGSNLACQAPGKDVCKGKVGVRTADCEICCRL